MNEVKRQKHSHLLAPAIVLASTSLIWGCTAETNKSSVVGKPPREVTVENPMQPTTRPVAPKPLSAETPTFWRNLPQMSSFHGYENGLRWRLRASGIELQDAKIERPQVDLGVIRQVWRSYGSIIEKWSAHYGVPIELIITAVSVESKGNPRTKGGNNIGLMQILVPTARSVLSDPTITEESLYDPNINIRAGTAYIAHQSTSTRYDPPKVAAAYNAGSLRTASNRWGMKQYGPYLDKTVVWFNAVLAFIAKKEEIPRMSYASYFQNYP